MQRVRIGTVEEIQTKGCLVGKAGSMPVCVFWSEGSAYGSTTGARIWAFPYTAGPSRTDC